MRCFTAWARTTASIGFNVGILSFQNDPNPISDSSIVSLAASQQSSLGITVSNEAKYRRTSALTINQSVLNSMMRTGALSANAHQQAKYFLDFQHSNSVSNMILILNISKI
jgi:hypothetical protein